MTALSFYAYGMQLYAQVSEEDGCHYFSVEGVDDFDDLAQAVETGPEGLRDSDGFITPWGYSLVVSRLTQAIKRIAVEEHRCQMNS